MAQLSGANPQGNKVLSSLDGVWRSTGFQRILTCHGAGVTKQVRLERIVRFAAFAADGVKEAIVNW